MKKQILMIMATMAVLGGCASTPKTTAAPSDRIVANWDSSKEGVYLTREIRNDDGHIGVLREFELMRNYAGKNIKGILIEVQPFNSYANRARLDVSLNGQNLESHDIMVRQGRQHLYTDIDREIRDEVRELSLRYDPRQVSVQSITVLINEDRPWDRPVPVPGGGGGFPGQNRDEYSQMFDRVNRNRGGSYYDIAIPRYVDAKYLTLEAFNAPVTVYAVSANGQSLMIPGANGPRGATLIPGYPSLITLPGFGNINSIRIQAEGNQRDEVALKATVSSQPLRDNRPDPGPVFPDRPGPDRPGPGRPGPGPGRPDPRPLPVPVVTETCNVARFDASGTAVVATYTGSATGVMGPFLKEQACQDAEAQCRRDLTGRPGRPAAQTCRRN